MDMAWRRSMQNFEYTGVPRIYTSASPAFNWTQHQGPVDNFCSEYIYETLAYPKLFLLNIHYYAEYSKVDAVYSGHAWLSRKNVDQCRNKFVSSIEPSIENVHLWSERNLVQFVCSRKSYLSFHKFLSMLFLKPRPFHYFFGSIGPKHFKWLPISRSSGKQDQVGIKETGSSTERDYAKIPIGVVQFRFSY